MIKLDKIDDAIDGEYYAIYSSKMHSLCIAKRKDNYFVTAISLIEINYDNEYLLINNSLSDDCDVGLYEDDVVYSMTEEEITSHILLEHI